MSNPGNDQKINYVEFTSTDVARSRSFYSAVFGWEFQDYGPDYTSFSAGGAGIDGGFRSATPADTGQGGNPLIVLYAADLAATEQAIVRAGGAITVPVFSFPGGRRFHFRDVAGLELAVWSK